LRAATLSFVCSENDRELAQKRFGGRAAVIPNAVELPRSCGTPSAQEALLFVGSLGYGPNRDAADWMIEHIWPLIRERKPNARFLIAGANPEALSGRGAEGVECLGFVPDLAPVYAQARLVVCPLRSGSGTRVKLLEAAAHARAIVSTSIGAEGISFVDGRDALIRDEPAAFASACVDLLEDAERATGLGLAARAFVQDGYSRSAVIERATRLVAAEMERHAPSAESPACAERGRRA
jgi:glycosyltransferase involved in cell wall biosynthesis